MDGGCGSHTFGTYDYYSRQPGRFKAEGIDSVIAILLQLIVTSCGTITKLLRTPQKECKTAR